MLQALHEITDASLLAYNTLGLDVRAERLITARSEDELAAALTRYPDALVLGGGSNTVFRGDVAGTVVRPCIPGIDRVGDQLVVGGGEDWHGLVSHSVELGLAGLENLALIPGSAGAAPVQNIGAYGRELADVLVSVRAWHRPSGNFVELTAGECRFSYRDSLFRGTDDFVITGLVLALSTRFEPCIDHPDLRRAFPVPPSTPAEVMEAIMEIRRRKLPDPAVTGNVGSFFKNPVVPVEVAEALRKTNPGLPAWELGDSIKLSAGWLIETVGMKGRWQGGARVSPGHALVIVNAGGATPDDILELAARIRSAVKDKFGIVLEVEPRLV